MPFSKEGEAKQPNNSDATSGQDDVSVDSSLSESYFSPLPDYTGTAFPEKETDLSTSEKPSGRKAKLKVLTYVERCETESSTCSEEGIEVEAVEFINGKKDKDDSGNGLYCPRRIMLLIVACLVIMTASAIFGFWILSGNESPSSSTTSLVSSANNADEGADVLNVTKNNSGTADPLPIDTMDADQNGVVDLQEFLGALKEENSAKNTTKPTLDPTESTPSTAPPPTLAPVPAPTSAPSHTPSATVTIESYTETTTGISSGGTGGVEGSCLDHNLVVSSSCVEGSASALSIASFCFASKRDGDWYWVRGSDADNGTTRDYDSWDYTEEIEGELTLLDLGKGGYLISLVRDSMQPYDEIITHEFLVPECVANNE